MQKLIIKVNCLLRPDDLEKLRQDITEQFYKGDSIILDERYSYELVEADTVEVVSSVN
jgi:hypothetical protein